MSNLNHLDMKKLCRRIWEIEGAFYGVGALFKIGTRGEEFDGDELFGMGQLLQSFARELSKIEELLHGRYTSGTVFIKEQEEG